MVGVPQAALEHELLGALVGDQLENLRTQGLLNDVDPVLWLDPDLGALL